MRTLAVAGRRGRIDVMKLAAVSVALAGSWAIVYGACHALLAIAG